MNLDIKLKFNFNIGYLNPYYRTAYSIPKRKR